MFLVSCSNEGYVVKKKKKKKLLNIDVRHVTFYIFFRENFII